MPGWEMGNLRAVGFWGWVGIGGGGRWWFMFLIIGILLIIYTSDKMSLKNKEELTPPYFKLTG